MGLGFCLYQSQQIVGHCFSFPLSEFLVDYSQSDFIGGPSRFACFERAAPQVEQLGTSQMQDSPAPTSLELVPASFFNNNGKGIDLSVCSPWVVNSSLVPSRFYGPLGVLGFEDNQLVHAPQPPSQNKVDNGGDRFAQFKQNQTIPKVMSDAERRP